MSAQSKPVVRSYRDLVVFQRSMDLAVLIYRIARSLPADERYALSLQLRRAAVSIPANIAEGHGREHLGEYIHHLSIASGSLAEIETEVELAGPQRLALVAPDLVDQARELAREVRILLAALIKALRKRQESFKPGRAA